MKHRILFITFILILSAYAFSENNDFSFFLTPQTGISCGEINEYLYTSQTSENLQSDLLWEEKPLINIGAEAGASVNNFFISTAFLYSIPLKCGQMIDSDYNNDFKTNLAAYDLSNICSISASIQSKYKFKISSLFFLYPELEAAYTYNYFKGTNGNALKGDSSHSKTGVDVPYNDENAAAVRVRDINYRQHYFRFYTGLTAGFSISNFNLSLTLSTAPFSYINALDIHTSKDDDMYYYMYFPAFFSDYKITSEIEYRINRLIKAYLQADIEWTKSKRGKGSFPFNGMVNGNKIILFSTAFGIKFTK